MGLAPGLREGTTSAFVTPRYRGVSLRTMGRMSGDATRARTDACGVAGRVAGSEDGDPALERAWDLRQDHPTEFARAVGALPRSPAATLLRGLLAQARLAWDDALRLSMEAERDIPDGTRWHARALEIIGNILVVLQQDDAAVSYLAAASDGYDRVGCQIGRSSSLQTRALLGFRTDREALPMLLEALELAETAGDDGLTGTILLNIVEAGERLGMPEAARQAYLDRALRLLRGSWRDGYVRARCFQADSLLARGDTEGAARMLRDIPDPSTIATLEARCATACTLAELALRQGNPERGVQLTRACLVEQLPACDEQMVRRTLSRCLEAVGDLRGALTEARLSADLHARQLGENASAKARALDVWHRTAQLRRDRQRQAARADRLEQALAELRAAHERIRGLSIRDTLTGLHNRQHLLEVADGALADAGPQRPGQVAMIDVDGFKKVNDTHGHPAGDSVLRAFGQLLRSHLPADDLVARYGGEEFVVIRLPRSEQADPRADATGLVRDLDDFRAVAACTQWRDHRGEPLAPVTVSVGVALITSPSLEPALLHADQTMYAAKRAGGDRVWTADGCPQPAVSPRR